MAVNCYANSKAASIIIHQLFQWSIKNEQQYGEVVTLKGCFKVANQEIQVPIVAVIIEHNDSDFENKQTWIYNQLPFTPIFVVEVHNIETNFDDFDKKFKNVYFSKGTFMKLGFLIDPKNLEIHSWRRNKNSVLYKKHPWEDIDTKFNNREVLPGFVLNLKMIEDDTFSVCFNPYIIDNLFLVNR